MEVYLLAVYFVIRQSSHIPSTCACAVVYLPTTCTFKYTDLWSTIEKAASRIRPERHTIFSPKWIQFYLRAGLALTDHPGVTA